MANERFFMYDFFLLRAPVFSIESLLELNRVLDRIGLDGNDEAAWVELRRIFSEPVFLEAIYLASQDLYEGLRVWLGQEGPQARKELKLLRAVHRYYSRMCTRCTPYGLFAGCAYGGVGEEATGIRFAGEKLRRHARFDMGFAAELAKGIAEREAIRVQLKFHVNNTLYPSGGKYIYVEDVMRGGRHSYVLSALTASPYIDAAMGRAAQGATMAELEECLAAKGNLGREKIGRFVRELIRVQVLTSELLPRVTGEDYIAVLIRRLASLREVSSVLVPVSEAYRLIVEGSRGLADQIEAERLVTTLVPGKDMEIVQKDVYFNMDVNQLNRRVMEEVVATSERLWAAVPPHRSSKLEEFMQRFLSRYEEQELPLVKVLDPDTGIGYGLATSGVAEHMPLLGGLAIRAEGEGDKPAKGAFARLLAKKIRQFYQEGAELITLTEEEVDRLIAGNEGAEKRMQRTSAYIFGSLLAASAEAMDAGQYQFLVSQLHAFSAGRLLGRFAHGEPALQEGLAGCIRDEELANPNAILAEIVHLPEGHEANVVLRPAFRSYEIPYLCNSAAEADHVIDINDLLVSVRNKRIVLRSKRHGKEVLPQLTSAHNATFGQPMYRFLSDLRSQHVVPDFHWEWTGYTEEPYLPRVEYRQFILARARWRLRRQKQEALASDAQIDAYLEDIRSSMKIPRYVVLAQDGDNELFIDFENAFCRHHVARRLKKQDVFLFEFLHMPDRCFIKDGRGGYSNQVILPLGTRLPAYPDTGAGAAVERPMTGSRRQEVTRAFPPGSEWLYVKIYGGNKTLETILSEIIKPVAEKALREGAIDKWFFIRYNDPEGHLRVRFHRSGHGEAWSELLPALSGGLSPLIDGHTIARMSVETYMRELERYGAHTIGESESLFFADSVAVSSFLDLIYGDEGEQLRWQMGLYSIDSLLNDFGYSLEGRQQLIHSLRDSFFQEFSNNNRNDAAKLERSLNDKYRQHYPKLRLVLGEGMPAEFDELAACFRRRSGDNAGAVAALKAKLSGHEHPQAALNRLMASYIHMSMNRLLLSRQRVHELVLYHYLSKYYRSMIAREQNKYVEA